jgi:poly-gamma-glutamate synthesis protein (capsule biosynthesis protein)
LGHHPHVLQGIEEYRGKLIFYSLGNFVFDRQIQPGTEETFILELTISGGKWEEAVLVPIKIADCRPRPVEGKEGEEILLRLQKYSQGLNTSLMIRECKGYLENK